jgi:transposase-like protein
MHMHDVEIEQRRLDAGASGLSATNIVRLKASWEEDYKAWSQRDLSQKRYVYWWADGVYFNVRLDEERTCVLVLIGATEEGDKELIAVVDGYRESSQSWRELLGQLKRLGLLTPPKLAIGDGSLGFWIALQEEYGAIAQQRCRVHKTANILDKMPKSVQAKAKQLIHEMYLAPTRKAALAAYQQFISSYQVKFPKACESLQKDKETLFTFYDFPAQHWPTFKPPTDRIDLRHCSSADLSYQRTRVPHRYSYDGVQTRSGSAETLAPATRLPTHSQSHYRCPIRRRRRSHPTSRLTCYYIRMRLPLVHNI